MQFLQVLLGLAATTSALDIYLRVQNDCAAGRYTICTNINPGSCCGSGGGVPSIAFMGIQTNWVIQAQGWIPPESNIGNCGRIRETRTVRNNNFVCLTDGPFTGGRYIFPSKKRADGIEEPCTSSQMPDTLVFENGEKYNITNLEEGTLSNLLADVTDGVHSDQILQDFELSKIE